jgi:hypothetical protein
MYLEIVKAGAVVIVALLAGASAASAGAGPSKSACAVAWNRGAGAHLHSVIAGSHVRAAFIDAHVSVGSFTWSKTGRRSSTGGRGCSIQFVLPSKQLLALWGVWKAGTVSKWTRPVPSGRLVPVPHNARVHSDGTVGFTG